MQHHAVFRSLSKYQSAATMSKSSLAIPEALTETGRAGPLYFVALTLCAFYNNMFHQIPRGGLSSHLETTLVGILSLEHAA